MSQLFTKHAPSKSRGVAIPANDETPKLKKASLAFIIVITTMTSGIYLPIWFLNRRKGINKLHSKEKLGKSIYVVGLICFLLITVAGCYSDVVTGMSLLQGGGSSNLPLSYLDLVTSILSFVIFLPFVQQALKVKRILEDHYNGYLGKNIKFSNIFTLLLSVVYLQYKINRLA